MIYEYVLGGIIASLLGFLLMYSLQKKKKEITGRIECTQSFENEEYQLGFTKSIDVIIVGAGLAGSALAYSLGKDGRQVHVIERDLTEPDRIVGEVLQPGGYLKLIELDLADCVNEIDAQRVLGYALYMDGKSIKLPHALENFHSDVGGRSFHYGRLVQRMRKKAASLPNVRLEQGTVTSLLQEKGTIKGLHYRTETGQETTAYAPLTVVCDGGFSKLRRSLSEPKVDVPSSFVGLILENSQLPFPNYAHVIMAEPSLILFYPISSTEIRCLVDIPGRKVPSISSGKMAHYLTTVVAPQIPSTLYNAFISAVDKGNIRTMPNSCMPAASYPTPGALLLGDALNMRHPLTGGGMTAALSDVVLLRHLLKPLGHFNDASSYIESFYTLRKPVAFTLNAVAGVFQKLSYASSDQVRCEMRRACFSYLSRGGVFASGLVALLSALNPCPWTLALHLFLVSSYTIGRLLLPFPSPKRIWLGARFIADGLCIIFSIIKAEGVGPILFPATLLQALQASPIIRNNVVMALFGIRSNSNQPPLLQ